MQTLIDLALAAGSDATGAGASTLQAANAAAPTAAPTPVLPSLVAADSSVSGVAPSAPSSVSALTAADATALAGADGARSRTGSDNGNAGADAGTGTAGDGAAALQQLTAGGNTAATDTTPTPTLPVHAPVDSAEFPQGVADRVSFAVDSNWSSAKLQVNPPQLGPIDLQIAVQGEHAQVTMSTHSAVTREALEASVPKLREMLGSQGFTQVSVDISQRSFQDRSAMSQPYQYSKTASAAPVAAAAAASPGAARASQGALDAYA